MVKNIVFDIGEVLLTFRPRYFLKKMFGPGEKTDHLDAIIFKSKFWEQLDRGIKTEHEVATQIKNDFPQYEKDIEKIFQDWPIILQPLPATDLVKKLNDKGFDLYYLSNFHLKAWEIVRTKYDFFSCFRGGIISAHERLLKPEEEIFFKLLSDYSLQAGNCLFIDDRIENVQTAEKIGFFTHQYLDFSSLKKSLKESGVL